MDQLVKSTGPLATLQRIAALQLTVGSFEELSLGLLREAMALVGALHGQLLMAADLRTVASFPDGLGEHFSFGIALDALADGTSQWDEAHDETAWCVPLVVREGPLALMMLGWSASRAQAEPRTAELLPLLSVIALALSERRLRHELAEREARLNDLGTRYDDALQRAITDGLTGLINHVHFKELLGLEIGRSKRYGNDLTLVMADIDFFKAINDTYGHLTGDVVIRRIAQTLKGQVRDCDIVARYGGEEFAILLPQTDTGGARVVAERIRQRVGAMVFTTMDKQPMPPITLSLGIGQLRMNDTLNSFVERSDQMLYAAKRAGRDRVCDEKDDPPAENPIVPAASCPADSSSARRSRPGRGSSLPPRQPPS